MSPAKLKRTSVGLPVKSWIFIYNFNQIWRFLTYFRESPNIKFYGISSSGSRADTCGQRERQTDGHYQANSHLLRLGEGAHKPPYFANALHLSVSYSFLQQTMILPLLTDW